MFQPLSHSGELEAFDNCDCPQYEIKLIKTVLIGGSLLGMTCFHFFASFVAQ